MDDADRSQEDKLVYVLPRIRIVGTAFRQEQFAISKADFLPDEPASWDEVIGLPRPSWLDIYRRFPYLHSEEPPEPARGTLVVSSDEPWLQRHISRLIAITFVMGENVSRWQLPADAFHYSSFRATATPHELVTLYTKSGGKTEDLRSLHLTPPLELRGVSESFRVDLRDERHVELIRRFDENPYDRLATACYHLFRTQFDNPTVASVEQDFAAYCACLEAAFDVSGPDYSKGIAERLADLYGQHPQMERWIKGLYSERSVFNHGISEEPSLTSSDDRLKALAEFRERNLNWDVLRRLCLDVIREQLQESIDSTRREIGRLMSPARTMLRQFFCSEALWNEVARVFTDSKSVEKILSLSGESYDEFIELCCAFLNGHRWEAMKGNADTKKVLNALKAMAAVFGEKAKRATHSEDIEAAHELFEAASTGSLAAIDTWARHRAAWSETLAAQDVGDAAKAVAAHTARLFCLERR